MKKSLYEFCEESGKTALLTQWDTEQNGTLTAEDVSFGSHRAVWWRCEKGHRWRAQVYSRAINGAGCPVCVGKSVVAGENDLAKAYPQLAQQWHPTRNGALTPEQVTPYSNRPAWWVCEKGHEYRTVIANRTRLHAGCPYCSGRQVLPGFNDLATKEPLLCKQWDAEKNAPLTPQMVTVCSHKKVWWRCDEGHEWEAEIALRTRTRRDRCPICDRRKKKRK